MGEIDAQFNLRKRHPFARYLLLRNIFESRLATNRLPCELDIPYGPSQGQRLDIFPTNAGGAPVLVFIHGGYFRALDKSQYRYIARPFVGAGVTVVLVNYDLAPQVPVAEIVRQARASFEWIKANVQRWNGSPARILLCGHSVGAFLAARILEVNWPGGSGIRRAALLSGLYDLHPMRRSYLNRDLGLGEADVLELNPRAEALVSPPPLLIAVGGKETDEFIDQSRNYSSRLETAGIANELLVLPGINHYSMSRLLARESNAVVDWMLGSL